MMRRRLPVVASAALLASSCVIGGAVLPGAAADPCGGVHQYGHWTATQLPSYPIPLDSGTDEATDAPSLVLSPVDSTSTTGPWVQTNGYSADVNNGKREFATNGRAINRSMDGGCTWSLVFSIDPVNGPANTAQVALAGADYRIVAIAAASKGANANTTIYAVVQDQEAGSASLSAQWMSPLPLYVLVSSDSGATWQLALPGINASASVTTDSSGQSAGVRFGALAVSPQDPAVAYLTMHFVSHAADAGGDLVYRTDDSGSSWTAPSATGPAIGSGSLFNGAAVDPLDKNSVWIGACPGSATGSPGNEQVLHSGDGGRTWQSELSVPDPTGAPVGAGLPVSVIHRAGKPAAVLSWCAAGPAYLATDGGKKFQKLTPPPSPFGCAASNFNAPNKTPQFLGAVLRPVPGDLMAATNVYPCNGGFDNTPQFWRMSLTSPRWHQISGLGLYGRNILPEVDGLRLGPLDGVSGIAQPYEGFGGIPKSLLIEYSGG